MADEMYNAEDVRTWNEEIFTKKVSSKVYSIWAKLETTKNLIREGKHVVAFEQLQGMGDSVGFLSNLFDQRLENFESDSSENDSD